MEVLLASAVVSLVVAWCIQVRKNNKKDTDIKKLNGIMDHLAKDFHKKEDELQDTMLSVSKLSQELEKQETYYAEHLQNNTNLMNESATIITHLKQQNNALNNNLEELAVTINNKNHEIVSLKNLINEDKELILSLEEKNKKQRKNHQKFKQDLMDELLRLDNKKKKKAKKK